MVIAPAYVHIGLLMSLIREAFTVRVVGCEPVMQKGLKEKVALNVDLTRCSFLKSTELCFFKRVECESS